MSNWWCRREIWKEAILVSFVQYTGIPWCVNITIVCVWSYKFPWCQVLSCIIQHKSCNNSVTVWMTFSILGVARLYSRLWDFPNYIIMLCVTAGQVWLKSWSSSIYLQQYCTYSSKNHDGKILWVLFCYCYYAFFIREVAVSSCPY